MVADRQARLAYTRVHVLASIRSGTIDGDPSRAQRFLDALGDILRPGATDTEAMEMLASEVAGAEVLAYALHFRMMRSQDWGDPLIQWLAFVMGPTLESFMLRDNEDGMRTVIIPESGTWDRELEALERHIVTRPFTDAIEVVCDEVTGVREMLSESANNAKRVRRSRPARPWRPSRSAVREYFKDEAERLLSVFLEEQTRNVLASSTIVRSLALQALADYWMH